VWRLRSPHRYFGWARAAEFRTKATLNRHEVGAPDSQRTRITPAAGRFRCCTALAKMQKLHVQSAWLCLYSAGIGGVPAAEIYYFQ